MDKLVLLQKCQSVKNLSSYVLNAAQTESSEVILFHVLKEICFQKLENEAVVVSEVEFVFQSHYVVFVIRIFVHQEVEKATLTLSELVINLCVSCNLDCHKLPCFVVERFHNLSERSFSQNAFDLVPVSEVVPYEHLVVTFLVVKLLDSLALTLQ